MHCIDKRKSIGKFWIHTITVKRFVIWYHDYHFVNKALHTRLLSKRRLHPSLKLRKSVDGVETDEIVPNDSEAGIDIIVSMTGRQSRIKESIANPFLDQMLAVMQ